MVATPAEAADGGMRSGTTRRLRYPRNCGITGIAVGVARPRAHGPSAGVTRMVDSVSQPLHVRLAAAVEAGSEHPIGAAIVAGARERDLDV
ncbi:MAG: hypothetical protein CK429_03365 [Mycobacterium sp.]|uniref:Uncharacterized protein n=2 Tax=Mycobacterium gordonae TaxID=1778 RepID=A0A1A6BCT4_MYCGO|nr:hypothetical protein A9W98_26940 [Mycobacterium gordonae]PJE18605.1 MAG: hypothetical protein CK429_03365 [Mycobacterium sp.]